MSMLYNGPVMNAIATENIVIGTLAGLGVLVLLVLFVYVARQILKKES